MWSNDWVFQYYEFLCMWYVIINRVRIDISWHVQTTYIRLSVIHLSYTWCLSSHWLPPVGLTPAIVHIRWWNIGITVVTMLSISINLDGYLQDNVTCSYRYIRLNNYKSILLICYCYEYIMMSRGSYYYEYTMIWWGSVVNDDSSLFLSISYSITHFQGFY